MTNTNNWELLNQGPLGDGPSYSKVVYHYPMDKWLSTVIYLLDNIILPLKNWDLVFMVLVYTVAEFIA